MTLQFQEVSTWDPARCTFEPWLFLLPDHLATQADTGWRYYVIIKDDKICGALVINVDGTLAKAPLRATFGAFQFEQGLEAEGIFEFVQFCVDQLHATGVKEIVLKQPPESHDPDSAITTTVLLNQGFQVTAEISSVISLQGAFGEKLSSWERRRLRQANEAGLQADLLPIEELDRVYEFILHCREERAYTWSIDRETLHRTVNALPERFFLFAANKGDEFAAAGICINIGGGVMYYFHGAHPRTFDSLSPTVLLIERIFDYSLAQGYRLLDLGTSAVDGKPNFGLLDFKLNLGAVPTSKFTFSKSL